MTATDLRRRQEQVVGLTRRLREDPEVWPLFERVGFRDYLSGDEVAFVLTKVGRVGFHEFNPPDLNIEAGDWKICVGLLERLAGGLLSDAELEGEWVARFVEDRWHTPSVGEGIYQKGTVKPVELGWVMALARDVDADPKNWAYFTGLTPLQYMSPRDRPLPNPIQIRIGQFRTKHCLSNRDSTLGIWPLLFCRLQDERYARPERFITDLTDVEQVKRALAPFHQTTPNLTGGVNLDVCFKDLNR